MHPRRIFRAVGYGIRSEEEHARTKERVAPRAAVVHLYDAQSELSVSLDLCLEDMAGRFLGSVFVRGLGITSILFAEDGMGSSGQGGRNGTVVTTASGNAHFTSRHWKDGDLPMLLALRDGKVVAWSSGLRDFCSDNRRQRVEPRAVEQWLDYAGVLIETPPPLEEVCRIRPEEEMLWENTMRLNGMNVINTGGICGAVSEGNDEEDIEAKERFDCGIKGCNKSFYHEHVGIKTEAQDGLLVSESRVVSSPSDDA